MGVWCVCVERFGDITFICGKTNTLLMWKLKKEKKSASVHGMIMWGSASSLAFSQCGWFGGCMCVKECYVLPNTKQATFRPLVSTAVFGLDSDALITERCSMKST